jgi:hypothetical protein
MTASGQALRVPAAIREVFDDIVARTGAFCLRHLDAEYAGLCAALAAGIVYAIGRVNFLADVARCRIFAPTSWRNCWSPRPD